MKRAFILIWVFLVTLSAFSGCGLEDSGNLQGDSGLGGKGTGGTGVAGGTCFPGAKVCPNKSGELICDDANSASTGCKTTTACTPCAIPKATAKCSTDGKCAIDSCDNGFADCDGDVTNGCEGDLNGDKLHCGKCDLDCTTAPGQGPGWICKNGTCEVNECCPDGAAACLGLRDCDQDKTNGCEVDVSSDPNNCKVCGTVCSLAHATSTCSQEFCVITQCDAGWANCDSNDANGCETNVATDSGNCGACGNVCNSSNGVKACNNLKCEIQCFAGFDNCDGDAGGNGCEVNLNTDVSNCGTCGNSCNPAHATGAKCTNGGCDYGACAAGYKDCDGNRANGCETNTDQDKLNCGNCGNKCPTPSGGQALCASGSCGSDCGGLTLCGGVCVNTGTDTSNCAGCGNVCSPPANSQAVCAGGCGFNCNTNYSKCGGSTQCYNTLTDPGHCGGGCANCPGPNPGSGSPVCASGACSISCTGGTPNKCGTGCYNFQSDKTHCGSCSGVCTDPSNGTANCSGGTCQYGCNSGLTLCPGNQCFNLQTDNAHCGACTTNCTTSGRTCNGGNCVCPGSSPDFCNGTCVNKETDVNNCGSCGHKCGPGSTCTAGACGGCASGSQYCDDTLGCKDCCTLGSGSGCGGPDKCCPGYTCGPGC